MRFLYCAGWAPWGQSRGYQQRLRMTAEALAGLGTVDVCLLDGWRSPDLEQEWPEWVGDAEGCVVSDTAKWSAKVMLGRASPVRRTVMSAGARTAAHARFFTRHYDLTWCAEPRAFEPVADLVSSPVVLDLHNVLSSSTAHKRRLLMQRPWLAASWRDGIRDPAYLPMLERRWRSWERAVTLRCERVVVCSELDRGRLNGRAAVVPNCYPTPQSPAGLAYRPGQPLRIGFVGLLDYQPNLDAVRWFMRAVLPNVRRLEPEATFELIGRGGSALQRLERRPDVKVHGYVDDLEARLAELSVVVVPIRFGGGTRFKILEAFAHRIPVVATTIGCEGIDCHDGEHLLVRDHPAAFARAVVAAHRDQALRHRLVTAAAKLHAGRYTWQAGVSAVRREVDALVGSVAAP